MPEDSSYKLVLTGNGTKIDRSISESVALQIISLIMGGVVPAGGAGSGSGQGRASEPTDRDQKGSAPNPRDFMARKRPSTDSERVTCLAYYLFRNRSLTQFKTRDLTKLNTEAAGQKFSNASYAARDAVTQGYLSPAGGGKKQVTVRGEAIVEALPDREKVKAAQEAHPIRRRATKKKKR